jgi:hypothetical protein
MVTNLNGTRLLSIAALVPAALCLTGCVTQSDGVGRSVDHSRALSGERTKMGQAYDLNPDCTVAFVPSERLIVPPRHGKVEIVKADVFSNYKSAPGKKCNTLRTKGVEEYYTSAAGYGGSDSYTIRTSYGNGKIVETTVNINVIK